MKKLIFKIFRLSFCIMNLFLIFPLNLKAQSKKAVTYQQQVESQRLVQTGYKPVPVVDFRLLANFEYASSRPSDLNDYRSRVLWNGTTPTVGTFSAPMGFSVGAGFNIWNGFVGIEFGRVSEELGTTPIPSTTSSVRDGFDLEQIALSYDYVYQEVPDYSYEFGGSVGYATKFRFYNFIENNGSSEVIYWSDHPIIIRARFHYNYHFSKHVRLRAGIGYELASSSNLKSEEAHPSQTIIQGQTLRDSNGSDVKVDFSGLRASAGIVVAF